MKVLPCLIKLTFLKRSQKLAIPMKDEGEAQDHEHQYTSGTCGTDNNVLPDALAA